MNVTTAKAGLQNWLPHLTAVLLVEKERVLSAEVFSKDLESKKYII
jgi:hypothetical protein